MTRNARKRTRGGAPDALTTPTRRRRHTPIPRGADPAAKVAAVKAAATRRIKKEDAR